MITDRGVIGEDSEPAELALLDLGAAEHCEHPHNLAGKHKRLSGKKC
jgi:hypothetical protein